MTDPNLPPISEQPSASRLLRSTVIALLGAIVILIVAVLPAEYGVDPTGLGKVLGLTEMGEIKISLAREAAADAAADAAEADADAVVDAATQAPAPSAGAATAATPAASATDFAWTHVTIVPLLPGEGKEVKLVLKQGASATYAWASANGGVNYDMHGDSTDAPNSYISYKKGNRTVADSGVITAAMDGHHGWFWRNRTDKPVSVTLRTRGDYAELKKMY